jgi:hypothetical protein
MLQREQEMDMGADGRDSVRVTATLSREQYAELHRVAKKQRVSLSWVVRRSVERTIEEANGGPLLPLHLEGEREARRG